MSETNCDSSGGIRHCGFCLKEITGNEIKLCGKCHRRAYCSRECQKNDWSLSDSEMKGQMHKNWCHLHLAEEDLDWVISPVDGKGVGVIAIRPILKMERIMVDGCQLSCNSHPGTNDLMPIEGSLQDKFNLNSLADVDKNGKLNPMLGLRMARVNHSCQPNTGHLHLSKFNVHVLFAERDINAGEEICINYLPHHYPLGEPSSSDSSMDEYNTHNRLITLSTKWGIECPSSCICRSVHFQKSQLNFHRLIEEMQFQYNHGYFGRAISSFWELRSKSDLIDAPLTIREWLIQFGLKLSMLRRTTIDKSHQLLNELLVLGEAIRHPQDEDVKKYRRWSKDISTHDDYLALDNYCSFIN